MVGGWMWVPQLDRLESRRCIVPDLPGIGASGDQPWHSLSDTADQVSEVIADNSGEAHVVGLSLGGLVGLHLAARHPEKASSLVVSGVPSGPVPKRLTVFGQVFNALYGNPLGLRVLSRLIGLPKGEVRSAFTETAKKTNPSAIKTITAEVYGEPLPTTLEDIAVPTLAVVGDGDTKPCLEGVRHLSSMMPNATGCTVPEVGHPWNGHKPDLFTDMITTWIDDRKLAEGLVPLVQERQRRPFLNRS